MRVALLVFLCGLSVAVAAHDNRVIKSLNSQLILGSEISEGDAWKKVSFKNANASFEFPFSVEGNRIFSTDEDHLSTDKKFITLYGQEKGSRSHVCFLIEMAGGCVLHDDYDSMCDYQWDGKKDAVLVSEYPSEQHDVSEYDVRLKPVISIDDFKKLKSLNGEATERACGVSLDKNNQVTRTKLTSASVVEKSRVSYQDILKTCKVQCNIKDLAGIDTQAVVDIPKAEIATINDIAFYMAKNGLYANAIDLLQKVIAADPNRTPAYLNLADARWDDGNKAEAIASYKIYVSQMTQAGKQEKIPARVGARLASNQ